VFSKSRLPAFCHPFRNRQKATLERVGQIISNRFEVIQSDWEDDIEGGRPDAALFDNKHRNRAREINAILCALQREFPGFTFPEGVHPWDLREDVKSNTNGRSKASRMPAHKVGS
jgi:hypothetical protein